MKLLSLATTLTSLIATVSASASLPSTYTLVADGGWTVVTDGSMHPTSPITHITTNHILNQLQIAHLYIGTGDIKHYPILIRTPLPSPSPFPPIVH